LASVWNAPVIAVDLDVEEPNLHLFLKPEMTSNASAHLEIPIVDETRCTYCAKWKDICQFKAISVMGNVLLTFPEMCHGCGGCIAVCPAAAILPGSRILGEISWGNTGRIELLMGRLRIGEAMSPPLMREVKAKLQSIISGRDIDVIVDAPPGVSCPAVNAVMGSDVILLVTEPTPFGLYDLALAHRAFAPLGKPMAVVVNRAGLGFSSLHEYCAAGNLPILAEIPQDRHIAEAYAEGSIIAESLTEYRKLFIDLADKISFMSSCWSDRKEAVGV
jgi:MinD superfamily P-loop ATPase